MKEKIKLKFISLCFQQNGLSCKPFYQLKFNISNCKTHVLIATFSLLENNTADGLELIDSVNCRVTNVNDFESSWNGPDISRNIQTMLDKMVDKLRIKYSMYHKEYGVGFYELTKTGEKMMQNFSRKYRKRPLLA